MSGRIRLIATPERPRPRIWRGVPLAELEYSATRRAPFVALVLLLVTGSAGLLATAPPASPPSISTVYYYGPGGYHLLIFLAGPTGAPAAQVHVTSSPSWSVPASASLSSVSGTSGLLVQTLPTPVELNGTVTVTATDAGGSSTVTTQLAPGWPRPPNGTIEEGINDLLAVRSGAYRAVGSLLVFFAGPNGTAPRNYSVQWGYEVTDLLGRPMAPGGPGRLRDAGPAATVIQHYYPLPALNAYTEVVPLHPGTAPAGLGPDLSVSVLDPSGRIVSDQAFAPIQFGLLAGLAPGGVDAQVGLAPLLVIGGSAALLLGLGAYGLDRSSGALDAYLARPVTPRGLLLARYLGILIPLELGALLGLTGLDLGLWARFGVPMPAELVVVIGLSLLGSLAGLLGAAMAASQWARSPLRLLTAILSMLVLFGFLWGPILTTLAPFVGAVPGTAVATRFYFLGAVLDPMQTAPALAPLVIEGTDLVSGLTAVLVGLLWGIGPLASALLQANRTD